MGADLHGRHQALRAAGQGRQGSEHGPANWLVPGLDRRRGSSRHAGPLGRRLVVHALGRRSLRGPRGDASAAARPADVARERAARPADAAPERAGRKQGGPAGHARPRVPELHALGRAGPAGEHEDAEVRDEIMRAPIHLPRHVARFAFLAALLLLPLTAGTQEVFDQGSIVWSMKGTLVANKEKANDAGWTGVSLGFTGQNDNKVRWMGAVHASIFGGDTFDAWSYINKVSHYDPTFLVVGPPDLAKKLMALPDGSRVHLEGVLDPRSRNRLPDAVKPLPASAAAGG